MSTCSERLRIFASRGSELVHFVPYINAFSQAKDTKFTLSLKFSHFRKPRALSQLFSLMFAHFCKPMVHFVLYVFAFLQAMGTKSTLLIKCLHFRKPWVLSLLCSLLCKFGNVREEHYRLHIRVSNCCTIKIIIRAFVLVRIFLSSAPLLSDWLYLIN